MTQYKQKYNENIVYDDDGYLSTSSLWYFPALFPAGADGKVVSPLRYFPETFPTEEEVSVPT